MDGRAIVTGVAGFIGSHLAERLLADGHEVLGIDCLTDHYDSRLKRRNLGALLDHGSFEFVEEDMVAADLAGLLRGAGTVFHEAAQPGVRASWGREFEHYAHHNIMATQRLLEAAKEVGGVRVVFASSSSVYGDVDRVPMREEDLPAPHSPYGVTKLSCEHLCRLYTRNHELWTVALRYFTVFGPRQRPDMAIHRLIRACLTGGQFELYGDGSQRRDFTHVDDIVEANLAAAVRGSAGGVYNIGGGHQSDLLGLIELIGKLSGGKAEILGGEKQRGDVRQTLADISAARRDLGYVPRVGLEEGLVSEIAWLEELLSSSAGESG
jgi:nucleoside-diphosphate-sugar epimerase